MGACCHGVYWNISHTYSLVIIEQEMKDKMDEYIHHSEVMLSLYPVKLLELRLRLKCNARYIPQQL